MTGLIYFRQFSITYLFMLALLGSKLATAESSPISYQISPLYQLSSPAQPSQKWLAPQLISSTSSDALVANNQGQFFQISNSKVSSNTFLDLSTVFPENSQLKLTAFTLHPNFSQTDKVGAKILYTAHIEYVLGAAPLVLSDISTPEELKINYHAVITEWQLDQQNDLYKQSGQPREILRVTLTDSHKGITQLGFNPHLKSWNEGFGLLHATLPEDEQFAQIPLYSGSVLRINPARFGLKHYTIPSNNPFLKKHKVLDEIVLFGAKNIQKISWTKHDEKKLVVTHLLSGKAQVSYGEVGSDWLKKPPSKVLWVQENYSNTLSTSLFTINKLEYLGLLHKAQNTWKITALNLSHLNKNTEIKEWSIAPKVAASQAMLNLIDNTPLQAALYNTSSQQVFTIKASAVLPSKKEESPSATESNIDYLFIVFVLLVIIILVVMGYMAYWIYSRYNGENIKPIIRKNFSHFSSINDSISLYKRRSTSPCYTFSIKDIVSTEVLLNDSPILLLNTDTVFDDDSKKDLLNVFALEQQYKMTAMKVRKVMMVLTDSHDKHYSVCLYLRKGDQRYTKFNYQLTQTKLIQWAQLYTAVHQSEHS